MQIEHVLESILTCPVCGFSKWEIMPLNNCLWYYERTNCHVMLTPHKGDCCLFCSYGTVKYPPMQLSCCCNTQGRQDTHTA